jgi:hypothetical protein
MSSPVPLADQSFYFLAFPHRETDAAPPTTIYYCWFQFPCWSAELLFIVFPLGRVSYLMFRRRLRPIPERICRLCGYDLRATPDRCPECGAIPPKPARS